MSNTFLPDSRWIGAGREGTTKLAWKRDPAVPAGQPALGRFDCVCGNTIHGVAYGGPDQACGRCGRAWDGRGWLVQALERGGWACRGSGPSPHPGPSL